MRTSSKVYSVGRCRKLVERCKNLTSLKITNTSEYKGPLNIMSVVIRAKKTLKSLELDSSIREWTQGALAELDQMKELRNLAMTFDINYPFEENIYELGNLAKLEHLEVLCFGIENKVSHHFSSLSRKLWENMFKHLKKLKVLEIQIANESMVASIVQGNPDLQKIRILFW